MRFLVALPPPLRHCHCSMRCSDIFFLQRGSCFHRLTSAFQLAPGKITEKDLREYLMRVTKLSQTKENLDAYVKAHKQAQELDDEHSMGTGSTDEGKKKKKIDIHVVERKSVDTLLV